MIHRFTVYMLITKILCCLSTCDAVPIPSVLFALLTQDQRWEAYNLNFTSVMGKCFALWNSSVRPKSAGIISEVLNCQSNLPCVTRWNSLFDSLSLILKYNDQHNEVLSRLGLPLFRDAKFEFIEEYVTVLHPLATALDRLQSDKECFCGCMLPTLLAVEKKLERQISNVKALLTTILRLHQASLSAFKCSSTSMLRITANQPFCHWYRIHSSN